MAARRTLLTKWTEQDDKLMASWVKAINPLIVETRAAAEKGSLSPEQCCDLALMVKKGLDVVQSMKAALDGTRQLLEKSACLRWITLHVTEAGALPPIRGTISIGSPRVTMRIRMPSRERDRKDYAKMMGALGAEPKALEFDALRPHWPSVCDMATKLAEEGKPGIPGITMESYPMYSLITRARPTK